MSLENQIGQMSNPDEFTRLCNTVFAAEYDGDFQVIDGTRGDEGNDGYVASEKCVLAIHCPKKPVRKTDAEFLEKALSDLAKAAKLRDSGAFPIARWTFVTPSKLANAVVAKIRAGADAVGLHGNHIESTHLAVLLRKHPHILPEFPDLQAPQLAEQLKEITALLKSGGQPTTVDAFIHGPGEVVKPKSGDEEKESPEMQRVIELRLSGINKDAKHELKAISYAAADAAVQLNAILGVFDLFDPASDDLAAMVSLCDRAIALAKALKSPAAEASLLAQKGVYLTQQFIMLHIQMWQTIQVENALGFGVFDQTDQVAAKRKLQALQGEYSKAFSDAMTMAMEAKHAYALSVVLLHFGIGAGLRGSYFRTINIPERAEAEQRLCRSLLLHAKDLNYEMGDELGAANAVFNLANQIRFFGEEEEAKRLVKLSLEVAVKHGAKQLVTKATWLTKTLESGRIPNHLAGERYS